MQHIVRYISFIFYLIAIASAVDRKRNCGVPKRLSGLIIRGESFSRGSFPWTVALLASKTQPPSYFCGGTLISSTHVVSGKKLECNILARKK